MNFLGKTYICEKFSWNQIETKTVVLWSFYPHDTSTFFINHHYFSIASELRKFTTLIFSSCSFLTTNKTFSRYTILISQFYLAGQENSDHSRNNSKHNSWNGGCLVVPRSDVVQRSPPADVHGSKVLSVFSAPDWNPPQIVNLQRNSLKFRKLNVTRQSMLGSELRRYDEVRLLSGCSLCALRRHPDVILKSAWH